MNGKGHSLLSAAGWFAAGPTLATTAGWSVGRWELAAGGLIAAGCGLLPDIDHPGATAARTFGRPGRALAGAVARAAGGHRGRTHRVSFALAAGAAVVLASASWAWAAGVVAGVVTAWAWRAIGPEVHWCALGCDADALIFGALAGVVTLFLLAPGWWLPAAVTLGTLGHLVGDKLFGGRGRPKVGGPLEALVVWLLAFALSPFALVQLGTS